MSETTALMDQYYALKAKHPGAILLFQIGDFYETFEEDARIVSSVLGITLTSRNNGKAGDVPLAGFPIKALDTYLPKLLEAGYRVAICEQVEDPKKAKKIVRRAVTEVVSSGVYWGAEAPALYLAVFWAYAPTEAVVLLADVTGSGRVFYHAGPLNQVEAMLAAFQPVEGLVYPGQESLWNQLYSGSTRVEALPDLYFDKEGLRGAFEEVYGYTPPATLLQQPAPVQGVLAAFLQHLRTLRAGGWSHLSFPRALPVGKGFFLDPDTLRNLEVLAPLHPEGKSLFDVLRATVTPMGTRLLRARLSFPLRDAAEIEKRLDQVEVLYNHLEGRASWEKLLRQISDMERRVARLAARKAAPRDLAQLYWAVVACQELATALPAGYPPLAEASRPALQEVRQRLEKYLLLSSEPPYIAEKPGEGQVIREGVDEKLDRARYLLRHAQEEIERLEAAERARTGIPSLKISLNRQLGYVIQVTAAQASKVPPDYRLRQQLAQGGARYTTNALDQLNLEIATAEETIREREQARYQELLEGLQEFIGPLKVCAQWAAEVDVHLALATLARQYNYVRPRFTTERRIFIKKGRHPVIERFLPPHQPYQPNSLLLTPSQRIMLLTGPNMAGKSAFLRQNALILLMAQIGSFVPAEEVEIAPVDQIFSRIGASDNLAAGQSTFLVEMQETARILHQATEYSFVILDEIGRGTSTYDGLAIAWAVLEYLHQDRHCRPWVLFATHYHELTELEKALPALANYHLAVEKRGDKLIFLHEVRKGAMRRSFGIAVAEMAGLPPTLIERARTLLRHFEKQVSFQPSSEPTLFSLPADVEGVLRRRLLELDPQTLTPIEALLKLQELRSLAQQT
ncbi:MAG: DNA mismatch repair protein MutS [Bacteroidia bacterium]|nr:MAG: DNA mismatch repair protein MutS [Bacteroidia bacterium]